MNFQSKTVLILDCGLFPGFAKFLLKDWGTVMYSTRWQGSYAHSSQHDIGEGLGLKVVDTVWAAIEGDRAKWNDPEARGKDGFLTDPAVDMIVVMDLGYADEVDHLRALGYRVYGAGQAERFESDRIHAKKLLESLSLPVNPYEVVRGEDLEGFLRHHRGTRYIKGPSKTRGDFETNRSQSLAYSEGWIRNLKHKLGPRYDDYKFLVEEENKGCVEAAFDAYTVDGQFPESGLLGIEAKGQAYCGHFSDDIPTQFTAVDDALGPYLKRHKARTFMSIETMIDKDAVPYANDGCLRGGMPCHGSEQLVYGNISQIMYEGAAGVLVEPKATAEWSAELVVSSTCHDWQRIVIPDDIEKNVRLVTYCKRGGDYYWMPQPSLGHPHGLATIGTIIATGPSYDKAVEKCKDIAAEFCSLSADLEVADDAFEKIEERFEEMAERGVPLD